MKYYSIFSLSWLAWMACVSMNVAAAFTTIPRISLMTRSSTSPVAVEIRPSGPPPAATRPKRRFALAQSPTFYNDFEGYNDDENPKKTNRNEDAEEDEDDDDDDDDDEFDTVLLATSQMDWRAFRRNLAQENNNNKNKDEQQQERPPSVSSENKELLQSQNQRLHDEFEASVWAHPTAVVSTRTRRGPPRKRHSPTRVLDCVIHLGQWCCCIGWLT